MRKYQVEIAIVLSIVFTIAVAIYFGTAMFPETKPPRRVILITLDTCRADALDVMPNMQLWAQDAVQYTYALSTAPWTSPAHASIMTGEYPSDVKLYEPDPIDKMHYIKPSAVTIAEVMRDDGFKTVAFVSAMTVGTGGGFAQGFEEFYPLYHNRLSDPRCTEVFMEAMQWFDEHPSADVFMWLHCWDTHLPYSPPPPDERFQSDIDGRWDYSFTAGASQIRQGAVVLTDYEKIRARQLYYDEARFFDKHFGWFIRWQEENYPGMVVFTSDHGEEFWEHGKFEHGQSLYDELIHVPLIVKGPGITRRIIDEPFSIRDVFWILAENNFSESTGFDAKYHNNNIFGPSLHALTRDGFRYILNDETKFEELYDYRYDPEMQQNLAPDMRKKIEEMRGLMYEFLKGKALGTTDDAVMREELKSIGYLGG